MGCVLGPGSSALVQRGINNCIANIGIKHMDLVQSATTAPKQQAPGGNLSPLLMVGCGAMFLRHHRRRNIEGRRRVIKWFRMSLKEVCLDGLPD